MSYDETKIDEIVLALLGAHEFEQGRVWKRIDFAAMDRLHAKGSSQILAVSRSRSGLPKKVSWLPSN